VTVTADALQVGCPSGAGDSLPLGTTGATVADGVADGVALGVGLKVGVGETVGAGVSTAVGVELEHAPASTRVARLTAPLSLRTRLRLRPLCHGVRDPGGEVLIP
jgi:hypothetical protein